MEIIKGNLNFNLNSKIIYFNNLEIYSINISYYQEIEYDILKCIDPDENSNIFNIDNFECLLLQSTDINENNKTIIDNNHLLFKLENNDQYVIFLNSKLINITSLGRKTKDYLFTNCTFDSYDIQLNDNNIMLRNNIKICDSEYKKDLIKLVNDLDLDINYLGLHKMIENLKSDKNLRLRFNKYFRTNKINEILE
jgi:hypothetical protein